MFTQVQPKWSFIKLNHLWFTTCMACELELFNPLLLGRDAFLLPWKVILGWLIGSQLSEISKKSFQVCELQSFKTHYQQTSSWITCQFCKAWTQHTNTCWSKGARKGLMRHCNIQDYEKRAHIILLMFILFGITIPLLGWFPREEKTKNVSPSLVIIEWFIIKQVDR